MDAPLLPSPSTVFVVDSSATVCDALEALAPAAGARVEFFATASEFFEVCDPARRGCLFVDPQVPGGGGLAIFERLGQARLYLPVVIISARGDVPTVVQAIKAGALNYLKKPCDEQRMAEALREALRWDLLHRKSIVDRQRALRRLARLNSGEQQVLELLVSGLSNRELAAHLGLSVRAIEVRRAKVMEKMQACSLADLVRQTLLARQIA
jgi:FixJ family two-component response regulator